MTEKRLSALCANCNIPFPGGDDPVIRGIVYDSRKAFPGCLFAALPGLHTDGSLYIRRAAEQGALAALCAELPEDPIPGLACILSQDPREDLSRLSAAFYDQPSEELIITGVTGTDGKSTTVYLLYQLLNALGLKTGMLSTVMIDTGSGLVPNPFRQSTPEAPEVQRILREMRDSGLTHAVVEATSHGLSPRTARLADVRFCAGVMTNVTHEHLEFHGSFEQYRDDKANLFRKVSESAFPGSFAVLNAGDKSSEYFRSVASVPHVSYGLTSAKADLWAEILNESLEGIDFRVHSPGEGTVDAQINLPGTFNVENTLAALSAALELTGAEIAEIAPLLPGLKPVTGRMVPVAAGQSFTVMVDYAHTPASFSRLLPRMKASTPGRLICVFGSAGERDREKRAIQGRIAGEHCDIIVLADEDPRGEDPAAILEDIASGCPDRRRGEDLFLINDRTEALRFAFRTAGAGDTVLLLGKGHETSIIYAGGPVPWYEETKALEVLKELGFGRDQTI
ncbi:MAG: UDP-N-acetylmuramoyl-L-alanyl-D-glutamate--2,6-diaminopimelate ligase [Spirochaetales bacterium]|nr:UDP-N-acetylmuramoyl-L-alanyl-D-glutamate--2,6-diaminopimelate ligase [Spirochaetales bacterium]